MNCRICKKPLNASQWSEAEDMKSCPRCSTTHGEKHVFYAFPDSFGETPARASAVHPDGPQSYCISCRAGHEPQFGEALYCDEVAPQKPLFGS